MPYKKFVQNDLSPYHISSRCINRDWFQLPMSEVWTLAIDFLFLAQKIYELEIHAFVLMSNHFHLLVTAPKGNLSLAMQYFLSHWSRQLVNRSDRINHTWAHRYRRCEIRSQHHLKNVYKYIYRNPVEANLCDRVENYPFSTLSCQLGFYPLYVNIKDHFLTPCSVESLLAWYNLPSKPEHLSSMKIALAKSTFKLPIVSCKKNFLDNNAL